MLSARRSNLFIPRGIEDSLKMMPSDSTEHDNIKLNRFTLSFIDKMSELENAFLDHYFDTSLNHLRKAIFLALFLYAVFGIADIEIAPNSVFEFWFIRYAIICPSLFVFLISRLPS